MGTLNPDTANQLRTSLGEGTSGVEEFAGASP
jgi:hypothetical protein